MPEKQCFSTLRLRGTKFWTNVGEQRADPDVAAAPVDSAHRIDGTTTPRRCRGGSESVFELFSSAAPKAAGSGNAITLLPDLAWIGQERNGTARREAVGQLCGF